MSPRAQSSFTLAAVIARAGIGVAVPQRLGVR